MALGEIGAKGVIDAWVMVSVISAGMFSRWEQVPDEEPHGHVTAEARDEG